MLRASRTGESIDKKNKQGIWKFFSNLFSSGEQPARPISSPLPQFRYHANTNQIVPGVRALPKTSNDFLDTELGTEA